MNGPFGVENANHGFMVFEYIVADANAHAIHAEGWIVTRIEAFAAAALPSVLRIFNAFGNSLGSTGVVNINAGGCKELLPLGTYRQSVEVSGNGSRVYVEFLYVANGDGSVPIVVVT